MNFVFIKCRKAKLGDAMLWRSCNADAGELSGGNVQLLNVKDLLVITIFIH